MLRNAHFPFRTKCLQLPHFTPMFFPYSFVLDADVALAFLRERNQKVVAFFFADAELLTRDGHCRHFTHAFFVRIRACQRMRVLRCFLLVCVCDPSSFLHVRLQDLHHPV